MSEETPVASIGDLTGMGEPNVSEMTLITDDIAPTGEEPVVEQKPKPTPAPTPAPKPEPEDGKGEPEDEDGEQPGKRTVPYSRFKTEKGNRQAVEAVVEATNSEILRSIKDLTTAIASSQIKTAEPTKDDIELASEALQKELGLEPGGILESSHLTAVLRKAVEMAGKKVTIPKDVQDKLDVVDEINAQHQTTEEATHFDNEWKGFEPALKKKYPNATSEMLAEARDHMNKLAHSKEYHKVEKLTHIMYDEEETFDTILKAAPGNKSGETGHDIHRSDETGEEDNIDIENLTPEVMQKREQRAISRGSGSSTQITNPSR